MNSILPFLLIFGIAQFSFSQVPESTTIASKDYNSPTSLGAANYSGISSVSVGVDHFTGRVQLNIPLGSAGDAFTAVSIHYSSGGFKPATPSTPLGLGWNLACGGAISRQVRGIPDEVSKTWKVDVNPDVKKMVSPDLNEDRIENFDPARPHYRLGTNNRWEPGEDRYVEMLANGEYDTQKDIFTVSAPGISASFILRKGEAASGQSGPTLPVVEFLTPSPLKIIPDWDLGVPANDNTTKVLGIKSFIVNAPDGSAYFFTKKLIVSSNVEFKQLGINYYDGGNHETTLPAEGLTSSRQNDPYVSAWMLEKIETPSFGNILYEYETAGNVCASFSSHKLKNPSLIFNANGDDVLPFPKEIENRYIYTQDFTTFLPKTISTEKGKAEFLYGQDMINPQGTKKVLNGINFYQFGQISGRVRFGYAYLLKQGGLRLPENPGTSSEISRLVLNRLAIYDQHGNSPGNTEFLYHDGNNSGKGFPLFDDGHLDYWGYFNGRTLTGDYYVNENRMDEGMPDLSHTIIGMIYEIKKPDGTTTSIHYEQNKSYENLKSSDFQQFVAGGVRVLKIRSQSPVAGSAVLEKTFLYGRSDFTASADPNSETWKGGFPLFAQYNRYPVADVNNFTFLKKQYQGTLRLYKFGNDFRMNRTLRNFDCIQISPVYQLEDELGRSVVYTRVLEKNTATGEYSVFDFMAPEFISDNPSKISSGYFLNEPVFPLGMPESQQLWLISSFTLNFLNNPKLTIQNVSKDYNAAFLNGISLINHFPEEITKFSQYENRFRFSRQLDLYRSGGQLVSGANYAKDNFLLRTNQTEYSFFSAKSLKKIDITGLINYNAMIYAGAGTSHYTEIENAVKAFYFGENFPTVSGVLGSGNLFIYKAFDETIGGYQPIKTTQTSFDRKIAGSGSIEIVQEHTLITDATNPRLFGKPRSSYEKKVSKMNGHNDQVLSESWVQLRYPSDFLTTQEREHLENNIYLNLGYLAGANSNRNDFALAHLTHGIQDEAPVETYSYSKTGSSDWFLTKAEISIPYGWGNMDAPLISSQFQFAFPIKTKIGKNATTHLPVGFSPMDWSISGSFSIDPGYEKTMEILEVSADGAVLSSVPLIKKPGTNTYLRGEINSRILGYKRSMAIAEIAMAKGSECAYTSFEMPIVNSSDENWWAVYDFPKENESVNYTDIVNEGFTGGKSARVNYSFGPTYSLPLDFQSPLKDYIFEAWVRKAEISDKPSNGKLWAYISRADASWIYNLPLENHTFSAGSDWKQIRIKIPLKDYTPTEAPVFLRLFSESDKTDSNHPPNSQGFLIDEIRVYPADALFKSQSIDLETGSTFSVDAKGKMIKNLVSPWMQKSYLPDGNLRNLTLQNPGK